MSARSSKPKQLGSKQQYRFTKAEDIQKRFREQNEDSLIEALTAFRNQITVKHDESPVPASDGRLLLVKSWLDVSPEALEIFDIWEQLTTRQLPILTPVISVLSALVSLLSSHYTYLSLATPIVKSLLTQRWYSKLNLYLSTSHNELILVTLKLYRALSMFAGGRDRRTVLEVFPWDAKSVPKLLNMRRRKKSDDSVDILLKPDIRTLYVLFLLSFVDNTTSSSVKTSFLDRRRELLVSVFKGLHQDSYSVVRRVLEISWAGIWADPKIKKTMKLALFNEYTVSQLLRLYQRSDPEDHGSEDITADVVHHFLLAICTRPGTGICFKDRGWYPREDVEAEIDGSAPLAGPSRPSSRIYNIILANVLKTLKVNEDARQQELAYRILKVCPELVAGYWPAVSLTLEPRLSTRWIANIAFFGSVISLPVPTTSFHLSDSDLYRPSPPPLTTMTENILPSVNVRIHLSRGLQSSSALVQHCAAVALAKCLSKYGEVLKVLRNAEASLEEDEEGQWAIRRQELEREISRRVPEFQVIVAFAQQSSNMTHITSDHTGAQIKGALLAECAQRLLWSYHQWLPSLVAEARFDVGKLLQGVQVVGPDTDIKINRWTNIRQLHVLRLLKESDQFSLVGKTGSSRGTLSVLLKLYVCCNIQAMRTTLFGLLRHSLSSTILFQHDANELELWLSSLPFSGRTTPAKAPDGTPLTSEEDAVIAFLDDCAQRCLKTPYRYLENLEKTWIEDSGKDTVSMEARTALLPSPLLVAVLEQLEAKLRSDLLSPSDALSVFAFVRRLLWNLAQKTHSIEPLTSIAQTLVSYLPYTTGFGECVNTALRREIRLSTVGLRQTVAPSPSIFCDHNPAVEVFLERIEGVPCPELVKDRRSLACELIDWLRLTDQSLHFRQFERLVDILSRLSVVQRCSLFDYLDPSECLLPEYVKAHPDCSVGFPLLFMHSHDTALEDIAFRDILCKSLACSSSRGDSLTSLQYSLNLIDLRLVASRKHPMRRCNLIYLLHSIAIKIVRSGMDSKYDALLEILRLEGLRAVANDILPDATRNGFRPLLEVIDSEGGSECRTAISAFAAEWIAVMESGLEGMSQDKIATASMWIQFAESAGISALLDRYCRRETTTSNTAVVMVEQLVSALDRRVDDFSVSFLPSRISQLLSMRTLLPDSSALERVIDIALRGALPPFVDGRLRHLRSNCTIATSLDTLPSAFSKTTKASYYDVCAFLDKRCWTEYTASIVSHLIYMDSEARLAATAWLRVCTLEDYRVLDLAQITHALLDCRDPATWAEADAAWLANLVAVLSQKLIGGSLPPSDAVFYADCITASLDLPATISQQISKSMDKNLRIQARVPFHSNVLIVARCLKRVGPIVSLSMDVLVNCGLKWAVSVLSEDATTPEVDSMLLDLADLCETASEIDSSTVEALLTSIVHYHLGNQGAVVLAYSVLKGAKVKPVTVNRYIQAIVQHPRIYNFCSVTSVVKDDIVRLLSCLFNMHPTNSCQPSHVEPLLHLYGGTLSRSDQEILRVFLLFERIRKTSVSSLLVNWTPSIEVPSSTTTKALQNLEPNVVWRTCLYFPQWSSSIHESTYDDGAIYDPLFLALMCSLMVAEDLVMPANDWVQLFRTNIFSLFIRALSSNRIDIRQLALTQITAIHQKLQDADVYEKPHVLHILGLLKDLYRQDYADTGPERLPSYATLHLAHALRGVFYPSHFSYPITARFLLQRPELDPDDVPTLYTMLYSTSEQWRKERIWMIHLLSEGMVGRSEWKVLRRRHTWDLVASMLGVQEKDIPLRRGILEFLANLTSNQHAATSLLLRSSLLAWIELQLPSMHDAECIAWVRILDNIVATVNPSKIEAATKGEWRSTMSRCLLVILNHATCTQWTFVQATQVALRLAQLPIPGGMHGNELIKGCMKHLETMEIGTCLEVSSLPNPSLGVSAISMPPHTARGLWEVKESNVQRIWGTCVEALWTICMECESRQPEWYALTQRLLLWRALARYERPLPQWVHKEVVRNIDFLTH